MRIFLSYGHDKHTSMAQRLKRDLEAHGHKVWFDIDRLKPGGDWEQYIEDGLDWASASPGDGRFILLMTPHSVRRPHGYCLNELARAWSRHLPIMPVMVAEVEPPLSICRLQYLDMRDCVPVDERLEKYTSKFRQLLEAVEHSRLDSEGVQSRLLNYLDPLPYEADVAQHLLRFTGRDWVNRELNRWLSDTTRRVFWITGEAGVGKSALAAWLSAHRPEIAAFHACRFGNSDRVNPRRAFASIAYQLSTQLPDYQQRLNASNLDILRGEVNAGAVFDRLFIGPLGSSLPNPKRSVVILIDALDEATANGRNQLASIIGTDLDRTSPWLRLIVTSRPHEEAVKSPLQRLDPWKLEAKRAENIEDIRMYLRRELRSLSGGGDPLPETVERIIVKSEGLFLYVDWVRQELADGRLALSQVDNFPQGLGGIYASFFDRYFPDRERYAITYRPVLEAICAAREPLETDYLARLFGWSVYVKTEITQALGSLFPVAGGHIRAFHQSVHDWLTDEDRAGTYFTSAAEGHKRLAEYGWNQYRAGVSHLEPYSVAHLPMHLAACGSQEELRALLLDFNWLQAKLRQTNVAAVIADYDHLPSAGGTEQPLRLVQGALRLSAHIIGKDPQQFASQMVGRLLPYQEMPLVQQFIETITKAAPRPWLRPLWPVLHPPGTALIGTLVGHTESVNGVAVTADGRRVVSSSSDMTLKVWDLETGRELQTLVGWRDVALSADGRRAVTASWDGTLHVRDLETGCEMRAVARHYDLAFRVAVSANGRWAVSASTEHTLKLWDLEVGRELRTMAGHSTWINTVAVSADGRRAASASDTTLKVWDLETARELRTLAGHSSWVLGVSVSGDGQRAVSTSSDKTLKVWDLETGGELRTLAGHSDSVNRVALSPDGRRAVSASDDKTLKVWDLETGHEMRTLSGHSDSVEAVALSADGRRAVSASSDNTLKVWDLEAGREMRAQTTHSGSVNGVAVSADGRRVVSASSDKTLKVWDLETGCELHTLSGHSDSVNGVAVSADGRRAVSASDDKTLRVWDLETGHELRTLSGHRGSVNAVALSADGWRAVSGSSDTALKVWDLETDRELQTVTSNQSWISSVALSADGQRVVLAWGDGTLKAWRLEAGSELLRLRGHTLGVLGVALSADGRRAVSASHDKTLKVWDLETGRELQTLSGHSDSVEAVALSADGRRVVSASDDRMLRVWDLGMGAAVATFTCDAAAHSCAFAGEGKIVAGDSSGRVHFLSLELKGDN
jgi:WD40 repeat protein